MNICISWNSIRILICEDKLEYLGKVYWEERKTLFLASGLFTVNYSVIGSGCETVLVCRRKTLKPSHRQRFRCGRVGKAQDFLHFWLLYVCKNFIHLSFI